MKSTERVHRNWTREHYRWHETFRQRSPAPAGASAGASVHGESLSFSTNGDFVTGDASPVVGGWVLDPSWGDFDTGGFFDAGADDRLTLPQDGAYLASVTFASDINFSYPSELGNLKTGTLWFQIIKTSGYYPWITEEEEFAQDDTQTSFGTTTLSGIVLPAICTAGEAIRVHLGIRVYEDLGGIQDVDVDIPTANFSVYRLGSA